VKLITFEKKYGGTIYINPEHVASVEFGSVVEMLVDGETFERWDSVVNLSSGSSVSVFGCAVDVAKVFEESSEMERLFGWYDSNGDQCDKPTTKKPKT
jgi:hypothetical protein